MILKKGVNHVSWITLDVEEWMDKEDIIDKCSRKLGLSVFSFIGIVATLLIFIGVVLIEIFAW